MNWHSRIRGTGVRLVVGAVYLILVYAAITGADQSVDKAIVELRSSNAVSTTDGGTCTLPLVISNDVPLAGAQFKLHFDAGQVIPQKPMLTDRCEDMTLMYVVNGEEMIILVYSAEGKQIAPGSNPVLNIPCTFKNVNVISNPISVEEGILADTEAKSVPVVVRTTTMYDRIQAPTHYGLAQNCPNPFNPTTSIQYSVVSEQSPPHVTLKIYNLLGQEVRTLVNEVAEPGYYHVTWDGKDGYGSEVSSGVYFYRLVAGQFSDTKRMLLLK